MSEVIMLNDGNGCSGGSGVICNKNSFWGDVNLALEVPGRQL